MQYDFSQLMQLAQSPAGQQLMAYLQQNSARELRDVVSQASSGDFDRAKQTLTSLLTSEEAKKLLKQLEETR